MHPTKYTTTHARPHENSAAPAPRPDGEVAHTTTQHARSQDDLQQRFHDRDVLAMTVGFADGRAHANLPGQGRATYAFAGIDRPTRRRWRTLGSAKTITRLSWP